MTVLLPWLLLACRVAAETPAPASPLPPAPPPPAEPCPTWTALAPGDPVPPGACLDLSLEAGHAWSADDVEVLLHRSAVVDLRGLRLAGQPLGMPGAKAIAASEAVAGLALLDLRETGIGAGGARALTYCKHFGALAELRVSAADVGEDGQARLAERFGAALLVE